MNWSRLPALSCAVDGLLLHTWSIFLFLDWDIVLVCTNTNNYFFIITCHTKSAFAVTKIFKTFNNGSLGSRIDEERSEMRYVM